MKVFYYRHNKSDELPHQIANSRINFNELTFVLKGELNYRINGETVKVEEGGCIFIKNGEDRQRDDGTPCDYVSFNFLSDLKAALPGYFPGCVSGELKLLFSVCDEIVNKYYDWSDKINSVLELIIKLLLDKLATKEENPVIVKIKRFVQKKLANKLSLETIAAVVGYSPNYCDTLFKKGTGTSILNYVIKERVAKAKLLLQEDILSLKEIAETVGFEDYNYFSRTFKKFSGYSPSEYKTQVISKR